MIQTSSKYPQRVAASPYGMIATAHEGATHAGVEVLGEGGNAVDAAVAAAFALGACEPQSSGLGGQTMMLIYLKQERRNIALDGSSRAPSRATIDSFRGGTARLLGYRATTIPSTPAVLGYAAQRYGSLPLSRLIEPAIRLAEDGYTVTALQHQLQCREASNWSQGNAGHLFLDEREQPYSEGGLFRQPVLARTLRRLATQGVEDFYTGEIAKEIHADMVAHEGFICLEDLANIPWPIERRPLSGRFEELRVLTFPPPGAGRTLIEMLNILSHFPERQRNPDTPKGALLLTEVIRRAQLDRRDRPFDPNFYPQVENRRMTSIEYAQLVAKQIRPRLEARAPSKSQVNNRGVGRATEEGRGETTHLSVMDKMGNIVGLTQSIERVYGSFVATPSLGFLYNNYMSAFDYDDYTNPYYLRPNGVPWASVAPTIVFRGRKPLLVLGSPGSDRITSAILQVLLRIRKQSPLDAVMAPRLHCAASGRVSLEASWMRDDIPEALCHHGFTIDRREPFSFHMGCVQLVVREGSVYIGVADPRRDGSTKGPIE